MQFRGEVKEGKIVLDNPSRLATYLSGLMGQVVLSVKPFKETRTDKQNALYWAYMTEMGRVSGYSKEEMHEVMKRKFNVKTVEVAGEVYEVGGSTTRMTTAEFTEYVRQVEQFALEQFDLILNENEI